MRYVTFSRRAVPVPILVTHDQEEAFAVSDQVGVFKEGRLEQWDTPYNLYHEPQTPYVASFIGQGYFIRGQLSSPESVSTELGDLRGNRAYTWPTGGAVDVLLRPDDIVYAPDSALKARIVGKTFLGASTLYRLQLPPPPPPPPPPRPARSWNRFSPAMRTIRSAPMWGSVWRLSIWCCSRHQAASLRKYLVPSQAYGATARSVEYLKKPGRNLGEASPPHWISSSLDYARPISANLAWVCSASTCADSSTSNPRLPALT